MVDPALDSWESEVLNACIDDMTPGQEFPHYLYNDRDLAISERETNQWSKLFWGKVLGTVHLRLEKEGVLSMVVTNDELLTNIMEIQ